MAVDPDSLIGKFYRFLPRTQWPLADQRVLPKDYQYYMHPCIVVGHTKGGLLHVVTTTHTPMPSHTYAPLHFTNPRLDIPPLTMKHWLEDSREVYVTLSNRKTFTREILTEFVDERTGAQYELCKKSKRKLRSLVEGYEMSVSYNTPSSPSIAVPKPSKKAAKKAAKKVAAAPPAQAAKSKVTVPVAPKIDTVATKEKPLNVQDIKTSLSGLKLAVAALEALCEKLEASAGSIPATEVTPSTGTAELAVMSGALATETQKTPPVAMTLDNIKDEDCAASGVSGSTRSSKRYRIEKWFTKLWKKRTGLSLSSV